ncbi:hypothetical protein CRG98_043469, partial [Punica granatum]
MYFTWGNDPHEMVIDRWRQAQWGHAGTASWGVKAKEENWIKMMSSFSLPLFLHDSALTRLVNDLNLFCTSGLPFLSFLCVGDAINYAYFADGYGDRMIQM